MDLTTLGALRRLKKPVMQKLQIGSVENTALGFGGGTNASPISISEANKNFIDFRASTSATTGDTRLSYEKLSFSGIGGSGEVNRVYGVVNNVTAATGGTVNGSHITLEVGGANGKVSGAGNAIRATLGLRDTSNAGGTLSGIQVDSHFATGATVPATAACIRVTDTDVKKWANLLNVPDVASAGLLAAHTTQTMTHSIRIISADGTKYYIMCTNASTNRTGGA
jgi:hypothetical protein